MRGLLIFVSLGAVLGLAFWAYSENYRTKRALADLRQTRHDIALLHESLGVLRAEWAYLNRPERLRDLAGINFDRLGLLPLLPEQFGSIKTTAFPARNLPPVTDPVDTMAPTQ